MNTTLPEREPFVATQRPVRRFVAVLAVIAVAFGALWWSGYAAPRISAEAAGMRVDPSTGRASTLIELHNDAPASVAVRGLDVDYEGIVLGTYLISEGQDVTGHLKLQGGTSAVIEVDVDVTCSSARHDVFPSEDPSSEYLTDEILRVVLRTPLGLDRSRTMQVKGFLNPLVSQLCLGR